MGEIIYWKKFDEPKVIKQILGEGSAIGIEMSGEYVCTDERVELVNMYGGLGPRSGDEMILFFGVLFKNGSWHKCRINLPATQEEIEHQAEQYLQSLPK